MSLLLDALKRVEAKPVPVSAQGESSVVAAAVNSGLERVSELAGLEFHDRSDGSFLPPPAATIGESCPLPPLPEASSAVECQRIDAGAALGNDLAAQQIRQLAADLLAAYPNHDPLLFVFVSQPGSWEASELASALALALAEREAGEVLLAINGGRSHRWTDALLPNQSEVAVDGSRCATSEIRPTAVAGVHWLGIADRAEIDPIGLGRSEPPWEAWKRRYRYTVAQSDGGLNQLPLLAGADGVYLASELTNGPRQDTKDIVAALKSAGVLVRGSVLIAP